MKFTLVALVAGLLANQQPQQNHDMSKISFTQSDCHALLGYSRFPEHALRYNKQPLQYEEIMEQLDCQTYMQQKDQQFEEFRKREREERNERERKRNAERAKFELEFKKLHCADRLWYQCELNCQNVDNKYDPLLLLAAPYLTRHAEYCYKNQQEKDSCNQKLRQCQNLKKDFYL